MKEQKLTLVVLAAGVGSRYGGAKQAEAFGLTGEWLMDYAIEDASLAGFDQVLVVTREDMAHEIEGHLSRRWGDKLSLSFVHQEIPGAPSRKKPWGTAHALLSCKEHLSGPFLLVNSDDFYGRHAYEVMARHLRTRPGEYASVLYPIKMTLSSSGSVSRGLCDVGKDGYLSDISEGEGLCLDARGVVMNKRGKALSDKLWVSMNFFGFTPAIFHHLESFWQHFYLKNKTSVEAEIRLPVVIHSLLSSGKARMRAYREGKQWFGVTYKDEKRQVQQALQEMQRGKLYSVSDTH